MHRSAAGDKSAHTERTHMQFVKQLSAVREHVWKMDRWENDHRGGAVCMCIKNGRMISNNCYRNPQKGVTHCIEAPVERCSRAERSRKNPSNLKTIPTAQNTHTHKERAREVFDFMCFCLFRFSFHTPHTEPHMVQLRTCIHCCATPGEGMAGRWATKESIGKNSCCNQKINSQKVLAEPSYP